MCEVAKSAKEHGRQPTQKKRDRPLQVSGVGHGSDTAEYNVNLPIAVQTVNGECSTGTLDIPTISHSNIPGLLGLNSLTKRRAVIDCVTKKMYFMGPGDYNLEEAMPSGTQVFQLETAPSGHLVLPITKYAEFDAQQQNGKFTLDQSTVALPVMRK